MRSELVRKPVDIINFGLVAVVDPVGLQLKYNVTKLITLTDTITANNKNVNFKLRKI